MLIRPKVLQKHYLQQSKDATKTAKLWALATISKQLVNRQRAIAELYKIGYSLAELISGLNISKNKIYRALNKYGILMRHGGSQYSFSLGEWENKKAEYGYRCAYCRKKTKRLQVDHIVPQSAGGEDALSNVVPACSKCNQSKNKKPLLQWQKFNNLQLNLDTIKN